VQEAQEKICPPHKVYEPQESEQDVYDELHALYSELYFALGQPNQSLGNVLPRLIRVAESANLKTGTPA
jgi:L-ribulokinase